MGSTVGLRERKKAATRRAVHEATLRLTVEHGFDNVTVEAIAEAADISRRTFSNYFTGKEDALLYGEEQHIRALVQTVRDRPATESAWTALRASLQALAAGSDEQPDRERALRYRLARKHPALLARQLANLAALERDLESAIADRKCPQRVRPRVLVAAFLAGLRIAQSIWIEEEQARNLPDVIAEILDELATPFFP